MSWLWKRHEKSMNTYGLKTQPNKTTEAESNYTRHASHQFYHSSSVVGPPSTTTLPDCNLTSMATLQNNTTTTPIKPRRQLKHHNDGDTMAFGHEFKSHYDAAAYCLITEMSNNKHYKTGTNHWSKWRISRGLPVLLQPAQNANEANENILEIIRFMMYFILEAPGVNKSTVVTQYLVHVKDAHNQLMFNPSAMYSGNPFIWPGDAQDSRIRILKSKIGRWFAETPQEEGGRLPLTPGFIKEEIQTGALDITTHDGKIALTVQLLTMYGGFRMGELLVTTKDKEKRKLKKDCCVKDVEVFADTLHIKVCSKTLNKIETVVVYRTEVEEVMKEFGQNFDVFALVEDIIKGKHPEQLLFTRSDGSPFTYDHYMKILRATTDAMNIPRSHFGGHSGRIYMASLLALQGMQDSYIQNRGRWLSLCFKMYVRSLNIRKSNKKITHFKLSNLTFVLKGFPDTTEFRKRLR